MLSRLHSRGVYKINRKKKITFHLKDRRHSLLSPHSGAG